MSKMTEEDFSTETEHLASSEHGHNKDDDPLSTSCVEEGSSLLKNKNEKFVNGNTDSESHNHDDGHYEDETGKSLKEDTVQSRVEKNLYPNVLISASRDHSDIDTDEEDFQMRNAATHKRNDSGQGSSITDSSANTFQNDFKRLDLTDEESLAADSPENSLDNAVPDGTQNQSENSGQNTPTRDFSTVDLDDNVAEIFNKIQEGTDEVLSKARSSTLVANPATNVDASPTSKFDEKDFIDIPLDSPGAKQNLNTYAPRPGLHGGSTSPDLSDDLKKPSVTDTKSKSGFR